MWWKDRLQNRLKRPTILSPTNQHQCAIPMIMRTRPSWLPLASQSLHVHNGPRVSINNLYPLGIQYQSKKNSQNVWQCNGKQSLGWMQKKLEKFLPISHNDGIECLWEWALSYIFPGHRALPGTGHSMTEYICVQRKRKRVVFLSVTNKLRL